MMYMCIIDVKRQKETVHYTNPCDSVNNWCNQFGIQTTKCHKPSHSSNLASCVTSSLACADVARKPQRRHAPATHGLRLVGEWHDSWLVHNTFLGIHDILLMVQKFPRPTNWDVTKILSIVEYKYKLPTSTG